MFTKSEIDLMTRLVQGRVGFFNGWQIEKESEENACRQAAMDIADFLTVRQNLIDSKTKQVEEGLENFVKTRVGY